MSFTMRMSLILWREGKKNMKKLKPGGLEFSQVSETVLFSISQRQTPQT